MGDSEIVTALLSPIHNLAEQWFYPALKISAAKNLEKLLRLSFLSRRYVWAQLKDSTQLSKKCEMIQQ